MKKVILTLFVLLGNISLHAQETPERYQEQWTLEECIEYARQHNLQVKGSELALLGTKVELERSKAERFPSLNAGGGYSYSVGRSVNPFTNIIENNPISSQNYYISSNVTLFNGFSQQNIIRQNKAEFKANEFELASTINDISLRIVTAYTSILFNKELLANAEAQLKVSELQRERTRRQVEVGSLPQASLYELESQYASDELSVINAINNLELAKLNLKQLLQIPATEPFNIVDPELELNDVQEYPVSAQEVYDVAEDTQPAILAVDERIISSEFGLRAAKGYLYPSITAQGGLYTNYSSVAPDILPAEGTEMETFEVPIGYYYGPDNTPQIVYSAEQRPLEFQENTYLNQLDYNFRRNVGVSLNIPIFNGYSARSAVSRARIQQDQAQLQARIARQELRQAIEQATQDVKAAALTYRSNLNLVRSQREAFRSAEQRFNLGAANAVDFNLAKTNLDVAESNLIRAKYDYIFKTKILDFYLNKPLSFE